MRIDAEIVYVVSVLAAGGDASASGIPGAMIRFEVEDQVMAARAAWNNDRVVRYSLRLASDSRIYLPVILR